MNNVFDDMRNCIVEASNLMTPIKMSEHPKLPDIVFRDVWTDIQVLIRALSLLSTFEDQCSRKSNESEKPI